MPKPEDDDLPPEEVLAWISDVTPYKRSPEQGIADMKSHLLVLRDALDYWVAVEDADMQAEVRQDIRDIEARLAEYETQLRGRN